MVVVGAAPPAPTLETTSALGKRKQSNGPFQKSAFAWVSHIPLCNPLWVTKVLGYPVHQLSPARSTGKGHMGPQPSKKCTMGGCCHEPRFAPKHDLQLCQDFPLKT